MRDACIPVLTFGKSMADKVSVKWSTRAKDDLDQLYQFLLEQWTIREAEGMLDIVQQFEQMVSLHPKAFKGSPTFPNCRLAILHRNLTAVYFFDGKTVFVVTIFDNRSNDKFRGSKKIEE